MSSVDLLFAQVRVVLNAILESGIPRGLSENDSVLAIATVLFTFSFLKQSSSLIAVIPIKTKIT